MVNGSYCSSSRTVAPAPPIRTAPNSLEQATTILGSTLALGQTARRVTNTRGNGGRGLHRTGGEIGTTTSTATPVVASGGDEEGLSLSGIFDDHSDDEIRSLKTLTR